MAYKNPRDRRRYYQEWRNRPEVKERRRQQQRARRKTVPVQVAQRDGDLRRRYGITLKQYDALFERQGQKCAICRGADFKKSDWHLDHEHSTGAVRGILCRHCNRALGAVRDSVDVLKNAIRYLLTA